MKVAKQWARDSAVAQANIVNQRFDPAHENTHDILGKMKSDKLCN